MPAARISTSIVTFQPDVALLRRAVISLAAAMQRARDEGLASSAALYLVDNGDETSGEDARAAARLWPDHLGPAQVLHGHGNVGYGRANNLVLPLIDSDVHLVMNPDVEVDLDAIAAALRTLESHPEIGLVAPDARGDDGARQFLCKRYPSIAVLLLRAFAPAVLCRPFARRLAAYEMRDTIGERFVPSVPIVSGCFMLARTRLLQRVGGFDARYFMYFEDFDLSLRFGREAAIAYQPAARIVHHGGETARKGLRHILWFAASGWRFFSRHGWKIV